MMYMEIKFNISAYGTIKTVDDVKFVISDMIKHGNHLNLLEEEAFCRMIQGECLKAYFLQQARKFKIVDSKPEDDRGEYEKFKSERAKESKKRINVNKHNYLDLRTYFPINSKGKLKNLIRHINMNHITLSELLFDLIYLHISSSVVYKHFFAWKAKITKSDNKKAKFKTESKPLPDDASDNITYPTQNQSSLHLNVDTSEAYTLLGKKETIERKKRIREVDMCNKTNKDFYGTRPKSKIELKRDNIEREKKKQEIWERKRHKGLVDSIRIIYTPMGGKPRK